MGAEKSSASAAAPGQAAVPDQIGPYRILDTLGEGGMGTVYLAEQKEPVRRRAALKVIKLGMDSKAVLTRFEAERRALAMMEHSCIATVFDAGITEQGQPYFAMEYVKGIPITDYCDQIKLTLKERIELFQRVCSGVQHAHLKGVMHRDLKPGNVLVTVQDGRPIPKIIDFGLAKAMDHHLVEATIYTEQGQLIGTPEYMSHEQAGLGGLDVDTRTDVYSLGALLYQLLVGELPFSRQALRNAGQLEMQRVIREQEPEKPSTKLTTIGASATRHATARRLDVSDFRRRLRGDLDWIVLKALEKDRTRRYETALELAADLDRHLQHEPVLASPPSFGYRVRKFARRYRGQCAAAAAVFLAIFAGGIGTGLFWWDAKQEARAKEHERAEAKRQEGIAITKAADAEREKTRANTTAAELAAKVREFEQLKGSVLYDRAIAAEQALYPAWPAQIPAMEKWLREDCGRLLAMRQDIEQTVDHLRARTPPATEQEQAARFLHDTLAELLGKLDRLATVEKVSVEQRLRWASRIGELSKNHPQARATWQQARAAIARADDVVGSRPYRDRPIELRDEDVVGLVPIGMNPVTKLWEFYELRSAWDGAGDPGSIEIPAHRADGSIEVGEHTGIVFVLLPGGTFTMGAQRSNQEQPNFDPEAREGETPHEVTLAPFFLARHELTRAQWERLTGGNRPFWFQDGVAYDGDPVPIGPAHPAESIDWTDANRWMMRHGLSLPTEAQWEYGCRAGKDMPWWTGATEQTLADAANVLDETAARRHPEWGKAAPFDDRCTAACRVGSYRANAFGLHDVYGNVWEWCRDWYGSYGAATRPGDGLRLVDGSSGSRVNRGGSYQDPAAGARSARRSRLAPTLRLSGLGLRPARATRP
jgi:serine/threonine protein kinase/formylglycine-generating enzyme required for sulfatase activity